MIVQAAAGECQLSPHPDRPSSVRTSTSNAERRSTKAVALPCGSGSRHSTRWSRIAVIFTRIEYRPAPGAGQPAGRGGAVGAYYDERDERGVEPGVPAVPRRLRGRPGPAG